MTSLPESGTTQNRYTILGRLAGGGMAEIFLTRVATGGGVERHVVLKRVIAERSNDPHFASMFLDEARLAAQLRHPNIAQVYDIGKLAGSYFFTMEYVHGEDARHLLQRLAGLRRRLPVNHALHIASATLLALHHAHERTNAAGKPLAIVHRDVTPSNVMVAYDGSVKLLDFGVAKAAERLVESRSGSIKGKIAYLSPEQCRGDKLDRRSDIFSLGIVLHELLTTRRLFRRENDFSTMTAIVSEPIAPPSAVNPELGAAHDAVVMKALARNPDDRYPTAAAMIDGIEELARQDRQVMSVAAMGRFMRELYGERPEPWVMLEHGESESRAITITSEAITFDSEALATSAGIHEAGTLQFPTMDTPVRAALEAQLQDAPTIGRRSRSGEESDENDSFGAPATPARGVKTVDMQTVDLRAPPTVTAVPLDDRPRGPRPLVIAGGIGVVLVIGMVVFAMRSGDKQTATPADALARQVTTAPPIDAAPPSVDAYTATVAPDAAPVPTIAGLAATSDWDATLALCKENKPGSLKADDRMACGTAACKANKKAMALQYYALLAKPEQAELERVCKAVGIALLAPRAKDPCETNPLKCRKP